MKKPLLSLIAVLMSVGLMAQYNVTFSVDMTNADEFDPLTESVYVAGDFLSWEQPGSNPDYMLTPDPVDPNIYTIDYEFPDGDTVINFKYFIVADEPSWDNGEWDGDPNRREVLTGESTLMHVWGNQPVVVGFSVNMTNAEVFDPATDDVYIAGSLANGWAQPGTVEYYMMEPTEDNDMIYAIELVLDTGDYQYKYFRIIDDVPSWDNGEWTGDPNREVTVAYDMDAVVDIWATLNPGIDDINAEVAFELYPNPCQSNLFVDLSEVENVTSVEVYNMLGKEVMEIEEFSGNELQLNTADLTNGVYFVAVRSGNSVQTIKFVKE